MNILHCTGMPFPTKYGGVEKWLVENCKYAFENASTIYIAYSIETGYVEEYIAKIEKYACKCITLTTDNEILEFCINNRIDIVHFHFSFCGYRKLYKQLFSRGIRLFVHCHCENILFTDLRWKSNLLCRLRMLGHRVKTHYAASFFEMFLACSEAVAKQYKCAYFLPNDKVAVHYLGVTREKKETKIENDVPIIACTAFHSAIKGVDVLLYALSELKEAGVLFLCYQIGGGSAELRGEDTRKLHELCTRLNLDDRVVWVGITNRVSDYLRKSDIYCQPSRTEAISLSIAEAMQCGLPIVASNVGGIPELVHNEDNGFTIEPENVHLLAEKLKILINDYELREKMGAASMDILNSLDFYQDQSVKKLWTYYTK